MLITLLPAMFGPFDIRILNIVSGCEIRISDLSILKILLFDKVIIYFVIIVTTPTIELTAALDWSMVTMFVINPTLTSTRNTIDDA
jgi:hypothetical protein